ncbi:MAG TPA: sulfotransferase [Rhizomicrobium sp.]|nr:sulfotransferase [Rhizomicrobium sp.]
MKPIVVVTKMRSGSNLLGDYLDRVPRMVFLGEIFKKEPQAFERVMRRLKADREALSAIYALRDTDLAGFWAALKELFAAHEKLPAAKIFYTHVERADPLWQAFEGATILHLIRENVLASVVSEKLAARAKKWQAKEYQENYDAEPLEIRPGQCRRYLEQLKGDVAWARERFAGGDYFELTYDQVSDPATVRRLLRRALGNKLPLKAVRHVQQRRKPLSEIVTNYAEVAEFDCNVALRDKSYRLNRPA